MNPKPQKPKLKEIAARIAAHLKRLEADPKANAVHPKTNMPPFYHAHAYQGGRYVRVSYISFQYTYSLTREEAEAYLAWLDESPDHVGKHRDAPGSAP